MGQIASISSANFFGDQELVFACAEKLELEVEVIFTFHIVWFCLFIGISTSKHG